MKYSEFKIMLLIKCIHARLQHTYYTIYRTHGFLGQQRLLWPTDLHIEHFCICFVRKNPWYSKASSRLCFKRICFKLSKS